MNVGCVPVDECIIQLEFEHKIPQMILDSCARLISTIGAGRQDAQGIGSTSVHGAVQMADGETAGRENFWISAETPTRRVAYLHALSCSASGMQPEKLFDRVSVRDWRLSRLGGNCTWRLGNKATSTDRLGPLGPWTISGRSYRPADHGRRILAAVQSCLLCILTPAVMIR